MTAIVNTLYSSTGTSWFALCSTPTSFPAFGRSTIELSGYGVPFSNGKMFGCWSAWRAVKYPVGRMSASRRREESEKAEILEEAVGPEEDETTKSVPPALGTRTYCAWPPLRL